MTLVDCLRNYLVGKKVGITVFGDKRAGEVVDVSLIRGEFVEEDEIELSIKDDETGNIFSSQVDLDQDFEFLGYR